MLRFLLYFAVFVPFYLLCLILSPFLPLFAVMREGPADNNNATAYEPRLPSWLFWFDTTYDNSLWGDHGWRTKHAPTTWGTWRGMGSWLRRNCACGFSWSVIAWPVSADETFAVTSSGCGLDLDKSKDRAGWFLIKSSRGAFQFRWVKTVGPVQFSLDAGWLLDIYVKNPANVSQHPRAVLMCSPLLRKALS